MKDPHLGIRRGNVGSMSDRDLDRMVVLLMLLAAVRPEKVKSDTLFSRAASKATEKVVDVVDPDIIIDRVDVNAILERVDVDALIERVDINAVLDRVDIDRLMARVDMDAIIDQLDVKEIAIQAGIPELVRESTGELAGSALDVFRRQAVALDQIVARSTYRLIHRDPNTRPHGPPELIQPQDVGS